MISLVMEAYVQCFYFPGGYGDIKLKRAWFWQELLRGPREEVGGFLFGR